MLNREIVDRQIKQDWKIERVAEEEEERKSDGVESGKEGWKNREERCECGKDLRE